MFVKYIHEANFTIKFSIDAAWVYVLNKYCTCTEHVKFTNILMSLRSVVIQSVAGKCWVWMFICHACAAWANILVRYYCWQRQFLCLENCYYLVAEGFVVRLLLPKIQTFFTDNFIMKFPIVIRLPVLDMYCMVHRQDAEYTFAERKKWKPWY